MASTVSYPIKSTVPVIYATNWCPYCLALIAALKLKKIPHEIVNVDDDEQAADWVCSVNGGNRIVPTVCMPDSTVLTNPPASKIADLLKK